jgi:hypothetical protein
MSPTGSVSDQSTKLILGKPGAKHAESDQAATVRLDASPFSLKENSYSNSKRIPEGQVFGEIPLEAAKAYPIRIWAGVGSYNPRIAYADVNTHNEKNTLSVKLLPDGGKTAPHPQIVLFVNGPYHVEELGYTRSDPWKWTTWIELHLDTRVLNRLIDAIIKAEIALENQQ